MVLMLALHIFLGQTPLSVPSDNETLAIDRKGLSAFFLVLDGLRPLAKPVTSPTTGGHVSLARLIAEGVTTAGNVEKGDAVAQAAGFSSLSEWRSFGEDLVTLVQREQVGALIVAVEQRLRAAVPSERGGLETHLSELTKVRDALAPKRVVSEDELRYLTEQRTAIVEALAGKPFAPHP